MCTTNLHLAACRLFEQEEAHGPVAKCTEFWVERGVQVVKADLKQRISRGPETLFMGDYCMEEALQDMATLPGMKTFRQWCPEYRYATGLNKMGHMQGAGMHHSYEMMQQPWNI